MPQAESLAFRQPSFKPHGLRKAGDRRGSRISARRGRQEIDDLIWDGDERFLTYANTDLQFFKMFIAMLCLNGVEQNNLKRRQCPFFLPLRRRDPARVHPSQGWAPDPRFLQIRLGSESYDQISASPNRQKRAKSRDKTAGSLFTRVYTLVEFSQTKRCFFSFLKQNIQRQMIHQHHYRLHNAIHISLKTRWLFYSSCLSAYSACDRQMQSTVVIGYLRACFQNTIYLFMCAIVWGAPSIRKKGIKRLEHQKI